MEFQIGQVWIRLQLKGGNRGQINVVYPIRDNKMEWLKVFINNHPDEAICIQTQEYERGDAHEEKIAVS